MNEHFDPVDDWLGADVELLPAPSGTFDRIHRRAKRHKAVVAMSTAAGAAVVIAAAVVAPQVVSSLGNHGSGGADKLPSSSSSPSARPSHHPSTSPKPKHNRRPSAAATGSKLSITNAAVPFAGRLTPTSVTFVNGTVGAVIGQTTSSCQAGCLAVAGTSDYGKAWSTADAPPAGPPNGSSGVSQIRFLEQTNGWAYGPELYVTHDGGATWTKVGRLPGRVIDLATVGGSAFAVVASCSGTGANYADGCTRFALYTSPYYSNSFQPVPGAAGNGLVEPGALQLTSQHGYLLAGGMLFEGSPSGGAWHKMAISSGDVPACLTGGKHRAASFERGLIAPGADSLLYVICQATASGSTGGSEPVLFRSADAGQTWQLEGDVPSTGTATSVAIAPGGGAIVVAMSDGIDYSANGHAWHLAIGGSLAPASGFSYVGMTTQQEGVAVPADASLGELFFTADGGHSWRARQI
jgi:hypothetical protein